jgi:hypothetical protein
MMSFGGHNLETMKFNLITFFIFSFLSFAVFSQETEKTKPVEEPYVSREYLPDAKDFGITVNMTGVITNISLNNRMDLRGATMMIVRYNINDNMTFRLGLAPSIMNARTNNTDSVGKDLVQFDSTAKQSSISFRPGVEFHLNGTKRLDPYIAVDGEFGVIGKFSAGSVTNITDTTGTAKITRTITENGGFAFGAKLSLGMNYFVAKRVAFGLEYGLGIGSLITGGDRQEVLQTDPVSGSASTTRILSSARSTNTMMFIDPMVQLTFSYFFGL